MRAIERLAGRIIWRIPQVSGVALMRDPCVGFRPLIRLSAALLALAAAIALAGCAGIAAAGAAPAAPPQAAPPPAAGPAAAAAPVTDTLPNVDLTSELLFRLVYAEVALQRGEPGPAYVELMRVAGETGDPRVAHRATDVALAVHALPQALDAAELWHRNAPHDSEAAQTYASLLLASGRYEQARGLVQQELARSSSPVELLDRIQRGIAHAPDPRQGYAMLERLAQPYLADPATAFDVHIVLARGAHAAGDGAAALVHARAAVAARPDSEPAAIAVAQLLVEGAAGGAQAAAGPEAGAVPEATAVLEEFLRRRPDAIDARLAYARLLVGADRLEQAQREYEQVAQRAPRNADAIFALGVLALEAERFEDARVQFERYLGLSDSGAGRDQDTVFIDMSRVAEGERRYEEALDWLHRVKGADQANAQHEREAFILAHLNRVDDALKLLQQLPGDSPEQRTQRVLLEGQLLRDAHRYQDSYDLLDTALKGSPDDTALLYEVAMSAERLDRIDVMETRLRRLLELQPNAAHAYNALGYSLADRNIRLQEAYQLIGRALALSPDDGFIIDSMGWVQYRMGNLPAARESLARAFRLKADPEVAAHLGEVMWASGDHAGARTLLLDAQRRDGDSDTLRETLQRLNIQP